MKKLFKIIFSSLLIIILGGGVFFLPKFNRQECKNLKKDKAFNIIYTIEKSNVLKDQMNDINKDTLFIFDVDYTLTQPSNPAFQQVNFCLNLQMIKNFVKSIPESIKS